VFEPDSGAPAPRDDAGAKPPPVDAGDAGDASTSAADAGADANDADADAGPPDVVAPVAAVDVVTLGSIDVQLGAAYDPNTDVLSAPCTTDPSPHFTAFSQADEGPERISPDAATLSNAIWGGSPPSEITVDHRVEVAAFLARAGATPSIASTFTTVALGAGSIDLSGSETPAPSLACGAAYVSGLNLGARLVWGIDVAFDHDTDRAAAEAAYGKDVGKWFTRGDAAWIGAALAPKAKMTVRVLYVGSDGSAFASIANGTHCSFAAMSECAATLKALSDSTNDWFGKTIQTPPTAQALGPWAVTGFSYARPPSL
jgi:hypothetical protein